MTWWEENGYLYGRALDDCHWVCVAPMIFTHRLMLCDEQGVYDFYCYATPTEALKAAETWDGISDPGGEWIRHHASGMRRINGELIYAP